MKAYESIIRYHTVMTQRKIKTVSLPKEVLKKGMSRAKAQGRNFSNYLVQLIERDNPTTNEPSQKAA